MTSHLMYVSKHTNPLNTHTHTHLHIQQRTEREMCIVMCAVLAEHSWNVELVLAQGDIP